MRLLRLDLERYGPFTARSVSFREEARLHVVLGANEAGKSTALAAVTDLLFGIEERTRYAFLHPMPDLRIGAAIASRDGRHFAFRRRKGRGNTLVDGADAPLPEDALAPFLSGLGREVFCRAFGLDARNLREGGAEMLDSKGELGASLFAAGSGLRGYTALQADLDEEAQGIFTPRRAGNRSFYQAHDRYEAARRAIRETELREGTWKTLNEEIAAAAARLDAVTADRQRLAAERARFERLKRVAPLIAAVDEASARAEADAGLVEATDATIDRLGETLAVFRTAIGEAARVEADGAAAKTDRASIPEPSGLIARAEDIEQAHGGIEQFEGNREHLPRFRDDLARLSKDLDERAVRVGLPDGRTLADRRPSDAERARVEALVSEAEALSAETARIERELATARAEHEGLTRDQAESGEPVDPAEFREALKSFRWLPAAVSERANLDTTIRNAERVLRGKAARLSPPVADVAALATLSLPSAAAIAGFRTEFEQIARDRALAHQRGIAADQVVASTRESLRQREADRPIASRDDLRAARDQRDAGFAGLRDALAEGRRAMPADIAAYERNLSRADRLADDLAADAARVAEQAADRDRLERALAEAAAAKDAMEAIDERHRERMTAWAEPWRAVGIAPTSPEEMSGWLASVEVLIEEQGDLDTRRVDLAQSAQRIATVTGPLVDLGRRAGLDGLEGLDAGLLHARVEERLAVLASRWETTRDASLTIRATAKLIARHEAALKELQAGRATLQDEWRLALPKIGLAPEARIEEARSALAAWREVPALLKSRDETERRATSIEAGIRDFQSRVAGLIDGEPDLDPGAPSAAIRTLHKRLRDAREHETRRGEADKRLSEAERRTGAARRARDEAQADIRRLLAELSPDAAFVEPVEIEALQARLTARRRARAELAVKRAELMRASDGLAESVLRADLAETSADTIEARLAQIAAEQAENEDRGQIARSERDKSERHRTDLEAGTGAELAHAQKKAAEAEIASEARQWAVLKLASLMLSAAVARHRAGQQDPLLERAGGLFASLTGGSFDGLAQTYNDKDEPCIVGRRTTGKTVDVEGMSEGTRDQLYLALRLAHLHDYASRAEPAPFLADDLFASFDDARTGHGLEALAAIGDRIQPILFTHHRHVADLAQARLGDGADIIAL